MSIETDKFDALYKRLKPHGVTMTALLAKAVGAALASHPVMFAGEQAGDLVMRLHSTVGVCETYGCLWELQGLDGAASASGQPGWLQQCKIVMFAGWHILQG
jgi:hypothetical protein